MTSDAGLEGRVDAASLARARSQALSRHLSLIIRPGQLRGEDPTMNSRFLGPLVVAAVVALAGSSATPAFADNTAATYHQSAFIDLPAGSIPLRSFDISFVERSRQTYYLADRSNKAVDIFDASSNTFETRLTGSPVFVGDTGNPDTSGPNGVVVVDDRDELWVGDGM